jgi:hypothetical protein
MSRSPFVPTFRTPRRNSRTDDPATEEEEDAPAPRAREHADTPAQPDERPSCRAWEVDGVPPELLPSGWNRNWRAPKNLRDAMRRGGLKAVEQAAQADKARQSRVAIQTRMKEAPSPQPAIHDRDKTTTRLSFVVSVEAATLWRQMARESGVTLSEWLRWKLGDASGIHDTHTKHRARTT